MLQTEFQKLFISSLLHGKRVSQGGCQSFCNVFGEAVRQEEMKDGGWPLEMQPQRHDAHRAIVSLGLVFSSLCPITRAKAQINSIWWLAGDNYAVGAAHIQMHSTLV